MDRRVCLKIKLKSLAEEARIIRKEEKKGTRFRAELEEHRKGIVRYEARHTHLAYGFLRGRKLEQIEKNPKNKPDWNKVRKMIERYGACRNVSEESWDTFQKRREDELKRFEEWSSTGQGGILKLVKKLTGK